MIQVSTTVLVCIGIAAILLMIAWNTKKNGTKLLALLAAVGVMIGAFPMYFLALIQH